MDAKTAKVIRELEGWMPGVDDALPLPREAAEFVHALILATRARNGLEIGTSYGYSGLWMAAALAANGGTLVTVDRDSRKSAAAREVLDAAGLLDLVDIRTGVALEVLPAVHGPFDFVLNDADKEHCIRYIDLLSDKLTEGAVVITDNTRTHAAALGPFVSWIRGRADFVSTGIPIGNGMEMSVKHRREGSV